ncbi:hypothetical protein IGI04_011239 [Brassica rapa subsp. trilocularis]|uniref:Uncharacterized protein n=1 Tax=Brassica rapa subsp. trilocularis TaxID=1813537 RepID=A0ABQ7N2H9_BRACM|nr:hypothetical protein IGI04_011239 [Brassica rapa subsp. trilocularis]
MVHRVIEANDYGWVTFVCDSVCLEKPYICSSDDLLGKSSGCRRLTFSRLAVDDLPGSRLVNAESRHAIHKTYHKQNYYRSFLYKDKLGFHLSRQDQSTFKKSRQLLRSPDDFQEVQTTLKSKRLLGSPDDFQTTSRQLTVRTLYNKKLPNEEKSDIRTYQNAQKNPDDFLEVQTTLSEDFQEVQTTSRRLPDD